MGTAVTGVKGVSGIQSDALRRISGSVHFKNRTLEKRHAQHAVGQGDVRCGAQVATPTLKTVHRTIGMHYWEACRGAQMYSKKA